MQCKHFSWRACRHPLPGPWLLLGSKCFRRLQDRWRRTTASWRSLPFCLQSDQEALQQPQHPHDQQGYPPSSMWWESLKNTKIYNWAERKYFTKDVLCTIGVGSPCADDVASSVQYWLQFGLDLGNLNSGFLDCRLHSWRRINNIVPPARYW